MIKGDNTAAFNKGLEKAKELIHTSVIMKLIAFGMHLLEDADTQREYTSFTGNTITSLAFGFYEDNNLTDVIFINKDAPVHAKIKNGETVYLESPYEGKPRRVTGNVEITDDYGTETSMRFLQEYKPKGGNGIVMTTGTEYSTFLENVHHLNVLNNTYLYAENNALKWMKAKFDLNKPIEKQ